MKSAIVSHVSFDWDESDCHVEKPRTTEHGNGIRMALAINSPMVVCWFVGLSASTQLQSGV